jgi:signal transduction histidine kinase/CheY-like chemotaxis protein
MASERGTILLVEDDAGVGRLERLRLERAGYAVVTAATAEEALGLLGCQSVGLLVLDQRLASGVSGLDLYEQVKAAGHDLPAILVTGLQEDGLLLRALRAGVRDFVPKTADFLDYLVPAVAQVLRQVATERQLADARRHAHRARAVAAAALRIHAALSPENILQAVTEEACRIVRARACLGRLTGDGKGCSAQVRAADDGPAPTFPSDGGGPGAWVCGHNRPLRLNGVGLKVYPDLAVLRPLPRAWLGAPLVGRDGRNLGLLQLVDKEEGEFTEEDEAVLVQLASLAAVALENAQLLEALRQADRRKDEFLAMLAHELRNPLAPMRNALEIIRLRGPERRLAVRASWDMVERQVEHLSRLVDDLLDVARITRGKINLEKEPVALAEVVRRAVETSRPLIEGRRHRLEVRLPDEPLHVIGDLTRLAQVLLNLLNNAAKYTEEGGQITLTVERAAADPGAVVLRVRDTGVGIPPEVLPKVFDLFTQASRTLDRAQGGLGIGLTLVRRLVEMHGGSVRASSAGPGKGSEFVVRLPLFFGPLPAPAHGNGSGEHPAAGHRILVVDDNRDSASSLAVLLRLSGHEVVTAHDGAAALEKAEHFRPQLALLDIGLPGMDGYELARRLRQLPGLRQVRLAALTGYGSEEDRRRSRAAGFDHHLVKPVEREALLVLLAEVPGRTAEPTDPVVHP